MNLSSLSLRQFLVFASLGGFGTAVHYVFLIVCVEVLSVGPISASILGYVAGAITNFLANHHITFRSSAKLSRTAPRFFSVALVGFFLNWVVMWCLVDQLRVQYFVAQAMSTVLILGFNYVVNATWTFRGEHGGN
jgi:putative flippase GtrA